VLLDRRRPAGLAVTRTLSKRPPTWKAVRRQSAAFRPPWTSALAGHAHAS
jgi:hypothetical protein